MSAPRAVLLYRDTCGKCRVLSCLAVVLAMGGIERVPLSSARARQLTRDDPQRRGKLTLLGGSDPVTGWRVIPAAAAATLQYLVARRGRA